MATLTGNGGSVVVSASHAGDHNLDRGLVPMHYKVLDNLGGLEAIAAESSAQLAEFVVP